MDNGRKKNILLGVLIVGVISMTVAFAALSTNLRLNGTANVAATRWNIHFQNWEKVSIPTAGGHTNTAESPSKAELEASMSDNTNVTKVENVNVVLHQPGDTAKYTFEIINEGTIDAKLDNFTATNIANNDLVDYDVKCYTQANAQGTEVTQNSVLTANGGLAYCYLQVTYKDQSNSHTAGANQVYHQNQISTNLTAQWTWVQNDVPSAQSGGGSTPSNPYETTFNGNYIAYKWIGAETNGYSEASGHEEYDYWYTTLNPEAKAYVRNDGTKNEVCGVFSGGTVCFNNSGYPTYYKEDFENVPAESYYYVSKGREDYTEEADFSNLSTSGLKGYSLAKAEEMIAKGASSCDLDWTYVSCSDDNGVSCSISDAGHVSCSYDNDLIQVINDGQVN